MKVYIVTHYIDCEYDNIEKVFSSREKAEEYQELMRERYKCPRYYTSRKGEKLYITEDFYVDEYEVELSADRPQGKWIIEIDANGNTYGRCSVCGMRQYAGQLNFCPDCGAHMKGVDDENETQNSNLTFEKVMEKIQTQVIEFPDTHQKFIFERKIEMDGDSIKICDWEYKGIKNE